MKNLLQQLSSKAVWITLIVVFLLGVMTDHYIFSPTPDYGRDTVRVEIPVPGPSTTLGIPAVIPPKIIYRNRLIADSTALYESAWLQNANSALELQLDSLMRDRDSMRQTLQRLLSPHTARSPFHFDFADNKGSLSGYADQAYIPMSQEFGLMLVPTELYVPEITITKRPAWWVKPAIFLGGAATTYFITEHNSTGALVAGGITLVPLLVEF